MDLVAQADFDVIALASHPHIRLAELAQQVQRRAGLVAQRKLQRVFRAALRKRRLHVTGDAVEAVGGAGAANALMRTLVIVVRHPVANALTGIGEGGEDRVFEEFIKDGLPETLDFTQRHRVMRRAADVLHTLALEHLLKLRLAAPGHKLTAIVAENLAGCAPLADGAFDHLQHGLGLLLAIETMTDDVA